MTLQVQYLTFLLLVASGMLLGAAYDSYSVVLREWRFLRFLRPLVDFAYWVLSLIFVFALLLRVNHADFRFYIYMLLILGWLIYRVTLRQAVINSTVGIILAIGWVCMMVWKGFYLLVVQPLRFFFRMLYRLFLVFDQILSGLERVILWPVDFLIKAIVASLSWLLRPIIRPLSKWLNPHVDMLRKNLFLLEQKWKELRRTLSNWIIREDNDNKKPPA